MDPRLTPGQVACLKSLEVIIKTKGNLSQQMRLELMIKSLEMYYNVMPLREHDAVIACTVLKDALTQKAYAVREEVIAEIEDGKAIRKAIRCQAKSKSEFKHPGKWQISQSKMIRNTQEQLVFEKAAKIRNSIHEIRNEPALEYWEQGSALAKEVARRKASGSAKINEEVKKLVEKNGFNTPLRRPRMSDHL